MGVELCGQKLTWDDVRPFTLQFKMFRGSKRSGRIAQQDLVAYSIKMQEAKRRMSAGVLDHFTPPLTQADPHGVMAMLESLLEE